MEKWSAKLERFSINFFLDTNILVYLIDDTYPALTGFIKTLANMPVVSLFTSEYVLAELVEVRKKEDYYQEVIKQSKKDKRYINLSSFITHNKRYDIPHYPYCGNLVAPVKCHVDKDIEKIVKGFGIVYDSKFNDQLLSPMKDICLSTKISREDSLVLVSSLFRGDKKVIPHRVVLLTNDNDFEQWSDSAKKDIEDVLKNNSLTMPYVEHLSRLGKMIEGDNKRWDLINNAKTKEDGEKIAFEYVSKIFMWMFKDSYIGLVKPAVKVTKAPRNTLFVKVKAASLDNDLYTVVLDKDLSFLYCPQNKADFYLDGKRITSPFIPIRKKDKVGYVVSLREKETARIFKRLNVDGNMVFIHPDSN